MSICGLEVALQRSPTTTARVPLCPLQQPPHTFFIFSHAACIFQIGPSFPACQYPIAAFGTGGAVASRTRAMTVYHATHKHSLEEGARGEGASYLERGCRS